MGRIERKERKKRERAGKEEKERREKREKEEEREREQPLSSLFFFSSPKQGTPSPFLSSQRWRRKIRGRPRTTSPDGGEAVAPSMTMTGGGWQPPAEGKQIRKEIKKNKGAGLRSELDCLPATEAPSHGSRRAPRKFGRRSDRPLKGIKRKLGRIPKSGDPFAILKRSPVEIPTGDNGSMDGEARGG